MYDFQEGFLKAPTHRELWPSTAGNVDMVEGISMADLDYELSLRAKVSYLLNSFYVKEYKKHSFKPHFQFSVVCHEIQC